MKRIRSFAYLTWARGAILYIGSFLYCYLLPSGYDGDSAQTSHWANLYCFLVRSLPEIAAISADLIPPHNILENGLYSSK
jgi:hypothetical protein